LGSASRKDPVDAASAGRVVLSVDRWFADSIMDLWERLESDWRERVRDCVCEERDCGSVVLMDERGSVVSRLRYVFVVESFNDGGGR